MRRSVRAIDKLNEVKKTDDLAAINRAMEELQRASQAMAEHLYRDGGQEGGAAAAVRLAALPQRRRASPKT